MNCKEAIDIAEESMDRDLPGSVKRRLDLHLSRCESCRRLFEAERAEHARWFRIFNDPAAMCSLPPDFADRLAAAARLPRPGFWFRIPRWLKRVACFALLLSGAAFAATVVVETIGAKKGIGEGVEGTKGTERTQETEGTEGSGALGAFSDAAEVPYVPDVASVPSDEKQPSTDNQPLFTNNQLEIENNKQGETAVNIKQKTVVALAAGAALVAAPAARAETVCYFNGSTYIDMGKGFPVKDSVSLSAWVCVDPLITDRKPVGDYNIYGAGIVGQGYLGGETGLGFFASGVQNVDTSTHKFTWQVRNKAGTIASGDYQDSTLYTAREWHHYLLVRDKASGKARFYVDGALCGTEQPLDSSIDLTPTKNFAIGKSMTGIGGCFSGWMADVALWDVALTAADAALLPKVGAQGIAGKTPYAYFPLNEGSGNSVKGTDNGAVLTRTATGTLSWTYDASFHRSSGDDVLIVTSDPLNCGSPSPSGSEVNLAAGQQVAVSCGTTPWTSAAKSGAYTCTGWKLMDIDGNVVSSGTDTSFTYTHPSPAAYRRLEWQWETAIYVATTGNDGNAGTKNSPLATIGAAVTAATAVSVADGWPVKVYVADGEYTLSSKIDVTSPVAIVGNPENPANVVFNNAGHQAFSFNNTGAALKGVTVTGPGDSETESTDIQGGHIDLRAGLVEDCVIKDGNIKGNGGNVKIFSGGILRRCAILNGQSRYLNGGNVFAVGGLIENCLIAGGYYSHEAAGVWMWNGAETKVVNCTFVGNKLAPAIRCPKSTVGQNLVVNCVFYGNQDDIAYYAWGGGGGGSDASNFVNCAVPATAASGFTGSGCITDITSAAFKGYSSGNYAPSRMGGLVDAGTTWQDYLGSGASSETDLAGRKRLVGDCLDIGCYEYFRDGFMMLFR